MHLATMAPEPPGSNTLSALLPTADQTCFLRACLCEGEESVKAWHSWVKLVQAPEAVFATDRNGIKRLLPLLFESLRRNGATVDKTLQSYLRTAYVHEELRSHTYRRLCHDALAVLAADGPPVIVLKGAALAATVYTDWVLRHCHDIDVLLRKTDFPEALRVLRSAGFTPLKQKRRTEAHDMTLIHDSGLPAQLHSRLFGLSYYDAPLGELWARSEKQLIAGVSTHVLNPADSLLNVCGHASYSGSRASLLWICDSWHIMKRHPGLDWDIVLRGAGDSRLALVLSVMFDYLADNLKAPIPQSTLKQLRTLAAQSDSLGREAALFGARAGPRGSLGRLVRQQSSWRRRASVLRWLLLPSPEYVYSIEQMRHRWLLPVYYLYRPLRSIGRHVRTSLAAFRRRPVRTLRPSD